MTGRPTGYGRRTLDRMATDAEIQALVRAAVNVRDYLVDWSHRNREIANDQHLGGVTEAVDAALKPFGR
jgi:hypothetical protein